jgi:hypothetical protein
MAGFTANSSADILSEIRRTFREISKQTLVAMYDEWTTWLKWTAEDKGGYYHTE